MGAQRNNVISITLQVYSYRLIPHTSSFSVILMYPFSDLIYFKQTETEPAIAWLIVRHADHGLMMQFKNKGAKYMLDVLDTDAIREEITLIRCA